MDFSIGRPSRRQLVRGGGAFILTLGLAGGRAWAGGSHEHEAEAVVRRLVEHVLQLIENDGDNAADGQGLMAAIESQTDLGLLARMTLGRYWRQASAAQREDFTGLFKSYLLQSFSQRLRRYAGADLSEARRRFEILSARSVSESDVLVRSRVQPPDGPPLQVEWRLRQHEGPPVIIDLVVEGVSLLVTQRSEFGSVLERAGVDGLIQELRARVNQSV